MFNFDNVGGKIKGWAKLVFVVEAIAAVIVGLVTMNTSALAGLLIIVVGPVVAWISSWLMYGYGQLIENSDIIAEEYKRANEKHEKIVAQSAARKQAQRREEAKATIANPDIDEDVFVDITCPNCKAELSYTKGQLQSEAGVVCPVCDATISL